MAESEHCFDMKLWKDRLMDVESYYFSHETEISDTDNFVSEPLQASFLVKTSGSSGLAKWVVHSKKSLMQHARIVNDHLGVTKSDIFGLMLPTYHVGGIGIIIRALMSKATLFSLNGKWSASSCIDFLYLNKVSIVSFVPAQLVDIVSENFRCPNSVRIVLVGGGKLDRKTLHLARELGWPIHESYGMTETGSQIATGEFNKNGYLNLIDGWEVRLSDEGLLEVKSDYLFKGYLVEKAGVLEFTDPKADGWFTTSDRVDILDIDGSKGIKFLGRADLQVKILGELVDILALEEQLADIYKQEVYLVPLPDERRGMKLYPVVRDQVSVDVEWGGIYRLEGVVVVPEFPLSALGKVLRAKLVEKVESIVFPID